MQIYVSRVLERPPWLVVLQIFPFPILVFIAIVISLDLAKQDNVTLRGRVKSKVRNIIVIIVDNGMDRKFTFKNDRMKDINVDDYIELQYFKRTKAVISVKNIH